jgi:hypothetical protein
MTELVRTAHGGFALVDCLSQEHWTFAALQTHMRLCSLKVGLDPVTMQRRLDAPPSAAL